MSRIGNGNSPSFNTNQQTISSQIPGSQELQEVAPQAMDTILGDLRLGGGFKYDQYPELEITNLSTTQLEDGKLEILADVTNGPSSQVKVTYDPATDLIEEQIQLGVISDSTEIEETEVADVSKRKLNCDAFEILGTEPKTVMSTPKQEEPASEAKILNANINDYTLCHTAEDFQEITGHAMPDLMTLDEAQGFFAMDMNDSSYIINQNVKELDNGNFEVLVEVGDSSQAFRTYELHAETGEISNVQSFEEMMDPNSILGGLIPMPWA